MYIFLLPFLYRNPPHSRRDSSSPVFSHLLLRCWWWDGLYGPFCWSKNTPHYYYIFWMLFTRGQVLTILSWFWRERSTIFPTTSSSYAVDECKTIHGRHCVSFTIDRNGDHHHSLFILFLENTYVHVQQQQTNGKNSAWFPFTSRENQGGAGWGLVLHIWWQQRAPAM